MTTKPPAGPPALTGGERKKVLEAERARLFPIWREALERAKGNIAHASLAYFIDLGLEHLSPQKRIAKKKARGQYLTKRLGLKEYAEDLRVKAGHPKTGRPWPK